ncbi:MAG: hypothetical protein K0S58_2295 [Nitrospira sp.]|nr:hypothetical protein [Nitrospira sp.]
MPQTKQNPARITPHLIEQQDTHDHETDGRSGRPLRRGGDQEQAHRETDERHARSIDGGAGPGNRSAPGKIVRSLRHQLDHGLHHADIGELRGQEQQS